MTTEELYASMSTEELRALRAAFEADSDNSLRIETILFAEDRLLLIARELDRRAAEEVNR